MDVHGAMKLALDISPPVSPPISPPESDNESDDRTLNSVLGDIRSSFCANAGVPVSAIPKNSIDTVSATTKRKMERTFMKEGGIIRAIPPYKSTENLMLNLNPKGKDSCYVYLQEYGYVSLLKVPTSILHKDFEKHESEEEKYIQWMMNMINYAKKNWMKIMLQGMILGGFDAKVMEMFTENYEKLIENVMIAMSMYKDTEYKWWMDENYQIFFPVFPMIYEYKYGDQTADMTERLDSITHSEEYDYLGYTKLVINGEEKTRLIFDKSYQELPEYYPGTTERGPNTKSMRIPWILNKTSDIKGRKLVFSRNKEGETTAFLKYDKDYKYSRIIPFMGIHKDFLKEGSSISAINTCLPEDITPEYLQTRLENIEQSLVIMAKWRSDRL